MSELVTVKVFDNRIEAEIAQGLLSEQRIESIISADDCGGQLIGLSSIKRRGVELLVREKDEEKAVEVLQVLETDNQD